MSTQNLVYYTLCNFTINTIIIENKLLCIPNQGLIFKTIYIVVNNNSKELF